MALKIHRREREGILLLDLAGRLTAGEEVSGLRGALTEALESGMNRAVLNLREVEYIDSTGLGSLVICYTSLQKAGGTLKLLHLNRRNIELLVLTKLTTVFEVFNDEQEAVNSFFPDREIKRFDILSFIQQQVEQDRAD